MSFSSFFRTSCETREMHADVDLRTRYYRNSFDQCLVVLKKMATATQMEIRDVNKPHGEVYLLGSGFDCIVTISQINPIESGIDLKINYFATFGFNRPRKKAMAIYQFLNAELKFKGVALHP